MSLLIEYPYLLASCKLLATNHCYQKLIKTLKLVIDRHSQRVLQMNKDELLVFAEILHEFVSTLHSESTIPLTQKFADSVLNQYLLIIQSILSHHTLSNLLPDSIKLKLLLISVMVYNDYSRFDECEKLIHSAINHAQTAQSWIELVQLVLIRTRYVLFAVLDSPKPSEHKKDQPSMSPIDDIEAMISTICTQKSWQKYRASKQQHTLIPNENAKMPEIYRLFLRFLQCAIRMKFDSTEPAAKLLHETTADLLRLINSTYSNHSDNVLSNSTNVNGGRKRKLNQMEQAHGDEHQSATQQPRKRQKLNNLQSETTNSSSNSHNASSSTTIRDADICLLINVCALYNLQWIVRNSAFDAPLLLDQMRTNLSFLTATNECDVDEEHMTYFERSLMQCFRQIDGEHHVIRKQVDEYRQYINGEWFKREMVPLLQRTDARSHRRAEHSKLAKHVSWLNIDGLPEIIRLLFEGMECMHFGAMKDAANRMHAVQRKLNEHDERNKENERDEQGSNVVEQQSQDFGVVTLRFLVWNLSTHLALIEHSKLNENQTEISNMMRFNDEVKQLLKQRYCEQNLFKNTCSVKNASSNNKKKSSNNKNGKKVALEKASSMRLYNGAELILFDESENAMDSALVSNAMMQQERVNQEWMETFLNGLKKEESLNMHEFKSFLKMASTKLHYLSSHVALIIQDKKCTRNQVKRVHRLTQKQTDVISRFYIRLILEILKNGVFLHEDGHDEQHKKQTKKNKTKKNQNNSNGNKVDIKPIHDYMKMIFTQRFNTLHALPLVALCAVYAYCKVDEAVLAEFDAANKDKTASKSKQKTNAKAKAKRKKKSDKEEKDEEEDDEEEAGRTQETQQTEQTVLRRRITFLKSMLSQILSARTEGGYCCIVASILIYLYKLMQQCRGYEHEAKEMKVFLEQYVPTQWRLIEEQFADCPPIKRAVSRSFQDMVSNVDMKQQFMQNQVDVHKEHNAAQSVDQAIRRYVVDYHDHLYVAKHA